MNKLKILTMGASSSKRSINKIFAEFTCSRIDNAEQVEIVLSDFEVSIFSVDKQENDGIPQRIIELSETLQDCDGIILSLAEHNGSYTTAFKNILDWLSVSGRNVFKNKPMFLLSTSPGPRGAVSVINSAKDYFPHLGANIISSFSLPRFKENFSISNGILDEKLEIKFEEELDNYRIKLKSV